MVNAGCHTTKGKIKHAGINITVNTHIYTNALPGRKFTFITDIDIGFICNCCNRTVNPCTTQKTDLGGIIGIISFYGVIGAYTYCTRFNFRFIDRYGHVSGMLVVIDCSIQAAAQSRNATGKQSSILDSIVTGLNLCHSIIHL